MKGLFTLILFAALSVTLVRAQGGDWVKVPDNTTGVYVEMPDLPAFEQQKVWLNEYLLPRDIFSFKQKELPMHFEVVDLGGVSAKEYKKLKSAAQDELLLRLAGVIQKKEKLESEGIDFQYVEVGLPSGHIARAILFTEKQKLFVIWLQGNINEAYSLPANRFLRSWKSGEPVYIPEVVTTEEGDVRVENFPQPQDNWVNTSIEGGVEAPFPHPPFYRKVVIELGAKDAVVHTYSRFSDDGKWHYVITARAFGNEEGQLHEDALHEYVLQQMLSDSKYKLYGRYPVIKKGVKTSEFVLSKGFRFYRFQIFRKGDVLYQCMVKAKRKSIYAAEAERFFGGIKIIAE